MSIGTTLENSTRLKKNEKFNSTVKAKSLNKFYLLHCNKPLYRNLEGSGAIAAPENRKWPARAFCPQKPHNCERGLLDERNM